MTKPKRSVKFIGYGIITLFVLSAFFLIGEVYFRFQPEYGRTGFSFDSDLVWRLNSGLEAQKLYAMGQVDQDPFTLKFNAQGFRGPNFSKKKKEGITRIMVLGDSYTAGLDYPDDEVFTGLFNTKLNQGNQQYEVYNVGVPAWGSDQHYIYWIKEGIKYNPDYLIIMLAPNDMRELYNKGLCQLNRDSSISINKASIPFDERVGWFLSSRSSFFQFLQKKVTKTDYGNFLKLFHFHPVNYGKKDAEDWDAPIYLKEPFSEIEETYVLFEAILNEIKRTSAEKNIKLLLGKIPIRGEVDGTYDTEELSATKITDMIKGIANKNGVPFLNLNEKLIQEYENPNEIFMSWEYHLNKEGHTFIGNQLFEFFNTNK